jgi:very-short-patch-repair endonuclease
MGEKGDLMLPYNTKLKQPARELRENMTDAERCLWARLRLKHLGYVFCRQKPIGDYIVDFYCPKAQLVVEVDGGQHFTEDTASNLRVRDEYMRSLGLTVLRFSNYEVLKNTDDVTEAIHELLGKMPRENPLSPPLRKGDKR